MSVMSKDDVEHCYKALRLVEAVEDWAKQVSITTQDMEFVEPTDLEAKMPLIGDSSREVLYNLLKRYEEARAIMDLIKEQLLKLKDELPQEEVPELPSSKRGGSKHRGRSTREWLNPDSEAQDLPSGEIWPYSPLGSDSEGSSEKQKKRRKRTKRPKTEEEKNRHINKVFIRENGILPLLDPGARL
ncbi:hypothetical protein F52700_7356 [Fusarium sp. NRRL 52700]|nr:hypothetical protein F52700_7356 [Fusarium sp. NRRL 52700]